MSNSVSEQLTLKQRFYRLFSPATNKAARNAVRDWLQQKQNDYKYGYSTESKVSFDTLEELLEDLEK